MQGKHTHKILRDFLFGEISIYNETQISIPAERVLNNNVKGFTPEARTRHIFRLINEGKGLYLHNHKSGYDLNLLFECVKLDLVDVAYIYAWEGTYKSYGIRLVFPFGYLDLYSLWTFENNGEDDFQKYFWQPLQNSSIYEKTGLYDGWIIKELSLEGIKNLNIHVPNGSRFII